MRSLLRRSSYLLYIVPALTVFLLFRHYAIIEGLRMSLIDFNPRGPSEFVGFEHYIRVLQRPGCSSRSCAPATSWCCTCPCQSRPRCWLHC